MELARLSRKGLRHAAQGCESDELPWGLPPTDGPSLKGLQQFVVGINLEKKHDNHAPPAAQSKFEALAQT